MNDQSPERQSSPPDSAAVDRLRAQGGGTCTTPGCGGEPKVYGWKAKESVVDPYCQDCLDWPAKPGYYDGWDYL